MLRRMFGKQRVASGAIALLLVLALLLTFAMPASAAPNEKPANPATAPMDVVTNLVSTVTPVGSSQPCVYEVDLQFDMAPAFLSAPYTLITLVLDGTGSMHNASMERDAVVREAVLGLFNKLVSLPPAQQSKTFVNVVMFGSDASKAASLTGWAADGAAGAVAPLLTDYRYPVFPAAYYDAPAAVSATSNFVPLTEGGIANTLNEALRQLFYINTEIPYPAAFTLYPDLPEGDGGFSNTPPGVGSPVSQEFYYGNKSATFHAPADSSPRFPISTAGTYINAAMELAYRDLDAFLSSPSLSAAEREEASKYVLLLADGHDSSNAGTQSWAAALKANPKGAAHINTFTFDSTAMNVGTTATVDGLGARIWSILVGGDGVNPQEANWRSTYPSGVLRSAGSGDTNAAFNMISLAASPINDGSAFDGLASNNTSWQQFGPIYESLTSSYDSSFVSSTNFVRTYNAAGVNTFFSNFTDTAVQEGGARHVSVHGHNSAFLFDQSFIPVMNISPGAPKAPEALRVDSTGDYIIGLGHVDASSHVDLKYRIRLQPPYTNSTADINVFGDVLTLRYDGTKDVGYTLNFDQTMTVRSNCPALPTPTPTPTPTPVPTPTPPQPTPTPSGNLPPSTVVFLPPLDGAATSIANEEVDEGTVEIAIYDTP